MHAVYCPACGARTVPRQMGDDGAVPFCEHCDRPWFDCFHTCVLSVLCNARGEIALIRQSYGQQTYYVGVAGYMQPGETAETAALREIKEEIGVDADEIRYQFSAWHAPREQLMLCFCAYVKDAVFVCSQEVREAKWFKPEHALQAVRHGSIIEQLVQAVSAAQRNDEIRERS